MDVFNNFEKQLKLISKFNGVCFNVNERVNLEIGLKELMSKEKPEHLYFWGKITGEESDYYIAEGINFTGHYGFPEKKFYFSTADFNFVPLPETFDYHDKDVNDNYYKPLKGKPNEIIKKYKEEIPEGENAEKPPEENKEEQPPQQIQDPDASVDDNAPKKEDPKENFTEKLKLSYLVRQIDYDTSVVPEGAFKLAPEHEIRINRTFKGVSKQEIGRMERWMHFRPVSEEKNKILEEENAVFRFDIFDSIVNDTMKGSWSLQVDSSKSCCNVRSLLWPGYFATLQGNTGLYCGLYYGNAMKNLELPFMI